MTKIQRDLNKLESQVIDHKMKFGRHIYKVLGILQKSIHAQIENEGLLASQ